MSYVVSKSASSVVKVTVSEIFCTVFSFSRLFCDIIERPVPVNDNERHVHTPIQQEKVVEPNAFQP